MSCFDTVCFSCPACKSSIQVHSKAGACELANHPGSQVPLAIAAELEGTTLKCSACSADWQIHLPYTRPLVLAVLIEPEPSPAVDS